MKEFKVKVHSPPSPAWAYYEGAVTVYAGDDEEAELRARIKLHKGAFPDRPPGSWVVDRIVVVRALRG